MTMSNAIPRPGPQPGGISQVRAGSRKLIGSDETPRGRIEADGSLLITAPAASLWRVTMKLTLNPTVKHLISVAMF